MAALLLLVLNDHVLKPWLVMPRWLTGKLSDFAGLFYFPLLLTASFNSAIWLWQRMLRRPMGTRYPLRRAQLMAAAGLCCLGFCAVKLSPFVAGWVMAAAGWLGGRQLRPVLDPSDLVALVMLPLSCLFGRRFVEDRPAPGRGIVGDREIGG